MLNRANARRRCSTTRPTTAFTALLAEERARAGMRLLAWCLMPNHWHLVLWPRADGDLGRFVRRLTQRHTQAWHGRHGTLGQGHLYQGRYKAFLVQDDAHLLTVCRYVERNPLRAGLVAAAADWPHGSLASCAAAGRAAARPLAATPARRLGRGGRPARDAAGARRPAPLGAARRPVRQLPAG